MQCGGLQGPKGRQGSAKYSNPGPTKRRRTIRRVGPPPFHSAANSSRLALE